MKTKIDLKLAKKMAKSVADQINYVGLDAPSDAPYTGMEEIIESFLIDKKEHAKIQALVSRMTYKDAIDLEVKVNELLDSGKYD